MNGGITWSAGECWKVVVIDDRPFYDHANGTVRAFLDLFCEPHEPQGEDDLVIPADVVAQHTRHERAGSLRDLLELVEDTVAMFRSWRS